MDKADSSTRVQNGARIGGTLAVSVKQGRKALGMTESSNFSANQSSANRNFSQNFKQRQHILNRYLLNQLVSTSEITSNDRLSTRPSAKFPPPMNKLTPQQVFNRNTNFQPEGPSRNAGKSWTGGASPLRSQKQAQEHSSPTKFAQPSSMAYSTRQEQFFNRRPLTQGQNKFCN